MSEIKFACPVCGQHITCDSAKSGAQLACPTCFQQLVVPATSTNSKLILTAALAGSRPTPQNGVTTEPAVRKPPPLGILAVAAIAGVLVICALIAAFALRDRVSKSNGGGSGNGTSTLQADAGWKSDLTAVAFPDTPAAGRIGGSEFTPTHAILEGGTLTLRQGQKKTQELAVSIKLSANEGAELAGQDIAIDTKRDKPLYVVFRRRDYAGQPVKKDTPRGYVLRLQFDSLAGDRLPGKIYFCASDAAKSWVAGKFDAEVSAAPPPKAPQPGAPKPKR